MMLKYEFKKSVTIDEQLQCQVWHLSSKGFQQIQNSDKSSNWKIMSRHFKINRQLFESRLSKLWPDNQWDAFTSQIALV